MYSWFLTGTFLWFTCPFLCWWSYSSLSSLSIYITIVNSISGLLFASISFNYFSEDFSFSFICGMFLFLSIWLPLCVCFCVLGRSAMSSSLCRMALCIRCLMGPSGAVSRNVLCVYSYYRWILIAVCPCVGGSILRLAYSEDWPQLVYEILCGCWPHKVELSPAGFGACWDLLLDVPLVELIGSCSDIVWILLL